MELMRMCDVGHAERNKIRKRQMQGTMTEYYEKGYLCFDIDELATYVPRPKGRPPKLTQVKIEKPSNK